MGSSRRIPLFARASCNPRQLESTKFIQRSLEIVQDDGIGEKFEDEGEFPEGIDAHGKDRLEGVGDGTNVEDDEDDRENHGRQHDAESGGDADQFKESEVVTGANIIK